MDILKEAIQTSQNRLAEVHRLRAVVERQRTALAKVRDIALELDDEHNVLAMALITIVESVKDE